MQLKISDAESENSDIQKVKDSREDTNDKGLTEESVRIMKEND